MTLVEAQRRYRQRVRRMEAARALRLSGLLCVLTLGCLLLPGCLVTAIRTPIVDIGLDVRFHKPEWVIMQEMGAKP